MKDRGLYIHIPFCASKCAYCDFYSLPSGELHKRYVDALCDSARLSGERFSDTEFSTVYIGGGTPSILSPELLSDLFKSIRDNFSLSSDAEITLEANPATLDEKKLSAILGGGVNRLSFGCQSANENELKMLSRLHTFEEFTETFKMARAYGVKNVSVDLMYGIPLQTTRSLKSSIESVASLSPDHISLYGLRVEPNTPFGRAKNLPLPSDDEQCEMYLNAAEMLASLGYNRYEISNFAKDGKLSRHNLRYWKRGEYLGLGAAAHSYIEGVRYAYERDALSYIESLESGKMPDACESEALSAGDLICEAIMLSLRLEEGLDLEEFEKEFGKEERDSLEKRVRPYVGKFMTLDSGRLKFTSEGFLVSNTILSEII